MLASVQCLFLFSAATAAPCASYACAWYSSVSVVLHFFIISGDTRPHPHFFASFPHLCYKYVGKLSIYMKDKKKFRLPPLGQRLIKTTIAVYACLLIYIARGYQGMVIQSVIAAILCIQPYMADSKQFAIDRLMGTILGAVWGLLFLLLMREVPILSAQMAVVYAIMSLGVLISLYSTVLLHKSDSASLCAIVFVCVVAMYPNIQEPVKEAIDRIFDTAIGLVVAMIINTLHMPRTKDPDKLFFIHLQDLVPDRYAHISSYVLIALNHLYQEGARISLVTKWAPAFLISQMGMLETNVPMIVMDGAALYDIKEKAYLELIPIESPDARYLCRMLKNLGRGFCLFAVRDSTMIIYRQGFLNEAEEKEYNVMRRSSLRNYVDGFYTTYDDVAVLRTIDTHERINKLEKRLKNHLPKNVRMVKRTVPKFHQYSGLYFYHKDATVENMKQRVMNWSAENGMKLERIDVSLPAPGYRTERDATHLLHKVRGIYEPVIFTRKIREIFGKLFRKEAR